MTLSINRRNFMLIIIALAFTFTVGCFSRVVYDDNNGSVYAWRMKWFGVGPFPGVDISGPSESVYMCGYA